MYQTKQKDHMDSVFHMVHLVPPSGEQLRGGDSSHSEPCALGEEEPWKVVQREALLFIINMLLNVPLSIRCMIYCE